MNYPRISDEWLDKMIEEAQRDVSMTMSQTHPLMDRLNAFLDLRDLREKSRASS